MLCYFQDFADIVYIHGMTCMEIWDKQHSLLIQYGTQHFIFQYGTIPFYTFLGWGRRIDKSCIEWRMLLVERGRACSLAPLWCWLDFHCRLLGEASVQRQLRLWINRRDFQRWVSPANGPGLEVRVHDRPRERSKNKEKNKPAHPMTRLQEISVCSWKLVFHKKSIWNRETEKTFFPMMPRGLGEVARLNYCNHQLLSQLLSERGAGDERTKTQALSQPIQTKANPIKPFPIPNHR